MGHQITALKLFIYLVVYLYLGLCMVALANKTGHEDRSWWGWVPILNLILMAQVAGRPSWWAILLVVPLVNLIILLFIYLGIAKQRGKSPWLGALCVIPLVGLIFLGILSFSD